MARPCVCKCGIYPAARLVWVNGCLFSGMVLIYASEAERVAPGVVVCLDYIHSFWDIRYANVNHSRVETVWFEGKTRECRLHPPSRLRSMSVPEMRTHWRMEVVCTHSIPEKPWGTPRSSLAVIRVQVQLLEV